MVERILKYSTKDQPPHPKQLMRFICPIISIDHLSQHFHDLPVDDILALGDQVLLKKLADFLGITTPNLDQDITQPAVLGPLIDGLGFYGVLNSLEPRREKPCEILLYLSGHGMDPGNICLVPDEIKPHPARGDLGKKELAECYCDDNYLKDFYVAFANAFGEYRGPRGFVGGEVHIHQRGFIGVLGVLGLWCQAHCKPKDNDAFHHLVIVADCCFAGIWGNSLKCIMESKPPSGCICQPDALKEYRELLQKYPVSIQCATDECEASHGGLFTPLWHFLNDPDSAAALETYWADYEQQPVSDYDFETQHPFYVSTSLEWKPSWKCFEDPAFFIYLHAEQLKQLKADLQGKDAHSQLTRPYRMARNSKACTLHKILREELEMLETLNRPEAAEESTALRGSTQESISTVKQSLRDLTDCLFEGAQRSQCALKCFVLDKEQGELTKRWKKKILKVLPLCDEPKHIPPGVYVFQGGVGDMSLIVTPGQEENVILIDGTKTADCFKAAWNSTLKYLRRITHIVVTHHDDDHTTGIQLLLARYVILLLPEYMEGTGALPDLSRAIVYVNTRDDFLVRKNFRHEREIEALAKQLKISVLPVIINGKPQKLLDKKDFCIVPLLPKRSRVEEVKKQVPQRSLVKEVRKQMPKSSLEKKERKPNDEETKPVSSRGGTTAANVLSINLVAVWKRDAYLFTGDAHLKDVTEAAQDFLDDHPEIGNFKYVDVPHHGSKHSNVTDVDDAHLGLAGIPADNYLISHCGNGQNPSFQTVKDILKRGKCTQLHFLYRERRIPQQPRSPKDTDIGFPAICCERCKVGYETWTTNWHCRCTSEEEQAKIRLPTNGREYKFFPF